MVKIGPKKMFFCYVLLHPMSYAPKLFQMKDLIKIHIRGKCHQYSICCCEIKNFQSLLYCFKIHEMVPFWRFLGPYFPKYCSILLKFSPELVSNKINTVWKILQNFAFWLKWDAPKVYSFGPFWAPIYCRKTKNIAKNQNFSKSYILRNIK